MASPKRRGTPPKRKGPTPPNRARPRIDPGVAPASRQTNPVSSSPRYTPKVRARGPFRPTWHKVAGGLLVVLGLAIFIINDLALFDIELMPGGHNELWAMVAIVVAATSTWWFGWFDRPPGRG